MALDRYLALDPAQRVLAFELYESISGLPLLCPHGHVDPRLFAGPDYDFGTPVDLLVLPDHYILRLLYSQGITQESMGVARRDGATQGADIPLRTEFTRNLAPLLGKFGNEPNLTLILFILDESTYARELAPLAGHYPALKLGPPWWFHDSLNGIRRFFDLVLETVGLYNTVGFNDDTRAFPSIPARHDLWRCACANWLAGLVVRDIVNMKDALEMAYE